MSLNFKAQRSSLATKDGKNLWYPALVKDGGLITSTKIARRIAEKSSLTPGDVYNVIDSLVGELNDKLMNGHSVQLDGFGTFTAIIKANGNGVETPQEVNVSQINSMWIKFTPTGKKTPMQGMTRAMFEGVEFQRWKGDPYNPQYKGPQDDSGSGDGGGDDDDFVDPTT